MPDVAENYDAIEQAVMESPRGRWFLAEYAGRLRTRESAAIVGQITALEAAINGNHDAIMARLTEALRNPGSAGTSAPNPELSARHLKYFKQDEDIFEAAPKPTLAAVATAPEEKRGAKLTITRMGAEDAPLMPEPVSAEPERFLEPVANTVTRPPMIDSKPEEPLKRRIVIIRHKPGEAITVPLQNEAPAEMASAS